VPTVDEEERERRRPRGRDHRRETDDADHTIFQPRRFDRVAEERQRVHAAGAEVDDLEVVRVPTGLILLRPAVMVDGEEHRAGFTRRGSDVDGRFPAVGADLEQRSRNSPGGVKTGLVQSQAFVVGHEALCRAGDREQVPVEHCDQIRATSTWRPNTDASVSQISPIVA